MSVVARVLADGAGEMAVFSENVGAREIVVRSGASAVVVRSDTEPIGTDGGGVVRSGGRVTCAGCLAVGVEPTVAAGVEVEAVDGGGKRVGPDGAVDDMLRTGGPAEGECGRRGTGGVVSRDGVVGGVGSRGGVAVLAGTGVSRGKDGICPGALGAGTVRLGTGARSCASDPSSRSSFSLDRLGSDGSRVTRYPRLL
jgi:hypothetical protein